MQREQLDGFKDWFGKFVAAFYREGDSFLNENIRLKECHTHRVCKEMRQLAAALRMNEPDAILAESIGLFHDVGRFPQFQKYRTYKDTISENHSLLALRVIDQHRLLENLGADEKAVIVQAVEFHGVKELPTLDERTLHFARMIRDADKLDIFELLVVNYKILAEKPKEFKWELEFPDEPACSPRIIDAIMNRQRVDYRDLKTVNDAKLLQVGWVFDINFDYSLRQLCERGHLQAIIDLLPKTEEVNKATEYVLQYTLQRIETPGL